MKALEKTNRDVGEALELLVSECFDIPTKRRPAENNFDWSGRFLLSMLTKK